MASLELIQTHTKQGPKVQRLEAELESLRAKVSNLVEVKSPEIVAVECKLLED